MNLLCLVCRNSRGVDAVANAGDAASNDELRSCTTAHWHRSNLKNDTNDHNGSAKENGFASTKLVTKLKDEAGTEEASNSVDGNDEAFIGTVSLHFGEGFRKSRGGNNTTHYSLVVTKEQEVGDSNNRDEDLEHPTRLAPVSRNAMFVILDTWCHCDGR